MANWMKGFFSGDLRHDLAAWAERRLGRELYLPDEATAREMLRNMMAAYDTDPELRWIAARSGTATPAPR